MKADLYSELAPVRFPLEPLPGTVCTQFIRCGNPRCRCRSGQLHGPYYYRVWRDGKQVRKAYVKRPELEAVRAACVEHARHAAQIREMRRESARQIATLRDHERMTHKRRAEAGEVGTNACGNG